MLAHVDLRHAPCPACGQRPARIGKILRWAMNLKETQLVDLYARLARSQDGSPDIDPAAIKVALETFIRGIPA